MLNDNISSYKEKVAMIFSTRSLKAKLLYSFAILFAITAFSSVTAIYSISEVEEKMELVEKLDALTMKILLIRQKEKNFLLYNNIKELIEAKEDLLEIRKKISKLAPNAAEFFRHIPGRIRRYQAVMDKFIQHKIKKGTEQSLKMTLRNRGHDLMEAMLQNSRSLKNQVDAKVTLYKELSILLLWIALPIGLLFCIFLADWILEPLGYVRKKAGEIMSGKLKAIPIEPVANKCVECDKLIRSINLMLDTIECKKEQLVQSEKLAAIGKVTAGIAHEINNPLNNINLTAEVLLEDMNEMSQEEKEELLRDILVQVERARDIVHHLLSFSRKKTTLKEVVDLAEIVETTLNFLRNELKISNTKLKTWIERGGAIVLGNRNQLQQVLVNIILNAVQAMGRGGELEIKLDTDPKNKQAVLTIRDNGPGMPKEVLQHVLEPFYTTKKDGTGLGLSVSYGIIKDHDGDIDIETQRGKGTTMRIVLPLVDQEGDLDVDRSDKKEEKNEQGQ